MENATIILFVGFIGSMIAIISPIIKLNSSITKLNVTLDNTNKVVGRIDEKINEHEIRLVRLEEHNKE